MENIIEISGGGYTAKIAPAIGANCFSLRHELTGAELLRSPASLEDLRKDPYVYGIPLQFPPNRIADGRYTFNGREYILPINDTARGNHMHGMIAAAQFTVEQQLTDSVRLLYRANEQHPYLQFPHAFSMIREYRVGEDGLSERLTVTNEGDSEMPLGIGFHTALRAPFLPGGKAERCHLILGCTKHWQLDSRCLPTGEYEEIPGHRKALPAAPDRFSMLLSRDPSVHHAILPDESIRKKIVYTVDDAFCYWMLWNWDGASGFVCPEPQSWIINAPNSPLPPEISGMSSLMPGESRNYHTNLHLE